MTVSLRQSLKSVLQYSTATDRRLPVPIMSEILKVLQYVEASPGHIFAESLGIEDTAGMFPEFPVIRERGAYAMDSSQATGSCRKLAKGHKIYRA